MVVTLIVHIVQRWACASLVRTFKKIADLHKWTSELGSKIICLRGAGSRSGNIIEFRSDLVPDPKLIRK
jgi:hypothetical protein